MDMKASKKRLIIAVSVAFVATILVLSWVATALKTQKESSLSLEDIVDNPEKYSGERFVIFTIVGITLREDPSHRLIEIYYLVHIRDFYEYEHSFVISSGEYSKYASHIGQMVRFEISGTQGPGVTIPPDRLETNILVSKSIDPFSREFITIHIALADK